MNSLHKLFAEITLKKKKYLDAYYAVLIFLLGYCFFLFRLDSVSVPFWDEPFYISGARQFLIHGKNENWTHPPLGKAIISFGIFLLGDHPGGWRISSVVSGSLILVCTYFTGRILFRNRYYSTMAVLFAAFNQLLFIESRVACIDIHMFLAISLGMLFFIRYWIALKPTHNLYFAFLFFGLGVAIKWFSIAPLALCFLLLQPQRERHLRHQSSIQGLHRATLGVPIALSLATYSITFLLCYGMDHPNYAPPLTAHHTRYSLIDLFMLQFQMLKAQWDAHSHPLMAQASWYSWPFMSELTWLHVNSATSGVVMLGNPIIMWTGLLAMVLCIASAIRRRSAEAQFISVFYLGMLFFWAIIPRKNLFYYYYFPPAMMFSYAIPYVFQRFRVNYPVQAIFCSTVLFVFWYYYPLLSNS